MKFMIILVVGIVILAGGFFAGSCYIRGNSAPPPEPRREGNACLVAAAEAKIHPEVLPEVLALIQQGIDRDLTRVEEINLRETLRRMELPACDNLLRSITPATRPPTRTP